MTEPTWLTAARAKLGVRETPGPANNPRIMGWAKALPIKVLGIAFNGDAMPWCGLFAAKCVAEAGLTPPPIAIRAKAWANWGKPLAESALVPGAVLVFERAGGGHVGFYVGEDDVAYRVLGGNQSDAVTVTRVAKDRCIARRWPAGLLVIGRPVRLRGAAVDERSVTALTLLRRFWPALIVIALGLWAVRLDHLRADHFQTLTNERSAWSAAIADGEKARLADEVRFAQQQVTGIQTYATTLAARQPLIIHSKDTVTRYAQTDAGRILCRAAERVRDIDALDADLARDPSAPGRSSGALSSDATAPPAGR